MMNSRKTFSGIVLLIVAIAIGVHLTKGGLPDMSPISKAETDRD